MTLIKVLSNGVVTSYEMYGKAIHPNAMSTHLIAIET